jgi:hypothetical protein
MLESYAEIGERSEAIRRVSDGLAPRPAHARKIGERFTRFLGETIPIIGPEYQEASVLWAAEHVKDWMGKAAPTQAIARAMNFHVDRIARDIAGLGVIETEAAMLGRIRDFPDGATSFQRTAIDLLIVRPATLELRGSATEVLRDLAAGIANGDARAVSDDEADLLLLLCAWLDDVSVPEQLIGTVADEVGLNPRDVAVTLRHAAFGHPVLTTLFPEALCLRGANKPQTLDLEQRPGSAVWLTLAGDQFAEREVSSTNYPLRVASQIFGTSVANADGIIVDPAAIANGASGGLCKALALVLVLTPSGPRRDRRLSTGPFRMWQAAGEEPHGCTARLIERVLRDEALVARDPSAAHRLVCDLLGYEAVIDGLVRSVAPRLLIIDYGDRADAAAPAVMALAESLDIASRSGRHTGLSRTIMVPIREASRAEAKDFVAKIKILERRAERMVAGKPKGLRSPGEEAKDAPLKHNKIWTNDSKGLVNGPGEIDSMIPRNDLASPLRHALDRHASFRASGRELAEVAGDLVAKAEGEAAFDLIRQALSVLHVEGVKAAAPDGLYGNGELYNVLREVLLAGPLAPAIAAAEREDNPSDALRGQANRLHELAESLGPPGWVLYRYPNRRRIMSSLVGRWRGREDIGPVLARYQDVLDMRPDHAIGVLRKNAIFGAAALNLLAHLRDTTTDKAWPDFQEKVRTSLATVLAVKEEVEIRIERRRIAEARDRLVHALPQTAREAMVRLGTLAISNDTPDACWRVLEDIVARIEADPSWDTSEPCVKAR